MVDIIPHRSEYPGGRFIVHAKRQSIGIAMEMGNIELMVKLQMLTYIHNQRVVHRQFTPDTR